MAIYFGSARIGENGKVTGGAAGDQKQATTPDIKGEVSIQPFYVHGKEWYILRAKSVSGANILAERMTKACNNSNIGYDQNQRLGVIANGIDTNVSTECDCSSLVRQCVKEAFFKDPGNFTTATETNILEKTNLFLSKITFVSLEKTPVYEGDILITKTSGHTGIIVAGNKRESLFAPKNTIKKGAKGENVKDLQKALNLCGAYLDVDGSFGTKTFSAVKDWQAKYGLSVDGSYGPKSYEKMKSLLLV